MKVDIKQKEQVINPITITITLDTIEAIKHWARLSARSIGGGYGGDELYDFFSSRYPEYTGDLD